MILTRVRPRTQRTVETHDSVVTWWLQVFVFATYTGVFITLLRRMILREDFGTGPLPELEAGEAPRRFGWLEAAR